MHPEAPSGADPSPDRRTAGTAHYFSARPTSAEDRRRIQVTLAGREVEVETAGGVFSPGRIDLGTQVLLRTAPPPPPTGDLLDLGCGWGPIALDLALASPRARVWGVDVNERALDLLRSNAAALHLDHVVPARPEDVPSELRFEAIRSNPPIRIGKRALHGLLETWLPRLAPGGRAHLVVQRNLGADSLQQWLSARWPDRFAVTRLASAKGFRVLAVAPLTEE